MEKFKNSIRLQICESDLSKEEKIKLLNVVNEISGRAALTVIGLTATGLSIHKNVSDLERRKKRNEIYTKLIKKLEQRKKNCKHNRKCIEKIEDKISDYRVSMQR